MKEIPTSLYGDRYKMAAWLAMQFAAGRKVKTTTLNKEIQSEYGVEVKAQVENVWKSAAFQDAYRPYIRCFKEGKLWVISADADQRMALFDKIGLTGDAESRPDELVLKLKMFCYEMAQSLMQFAETL